jgi:hypothetical protein
MGSSALWAAVLRQTTMEVHSALGFSVTQTLVDLEKFYDHVPLSTVVETAYQVEYPLLPLALGLQMHEAPRRVATEQGISQKMWPTRSLMAGCGQSVGFARLTQWDVLEFAHAQYKPRELGTWVDDIIHQEVGKEEDVVDKAEAVVQGLVGQLTARGFRVSPKSVVISNPPKLARRVVQRLAAKGVHLQAPRAAKDLGIDAHGARRSRATVQARRRKASSRARAIKGVVTWMHRWFIVFVLGL